MKGKSSETRFFVKRFWIFYLVSILFILLLFFLIATGIFGFMPSFEELENPRSNLASEVYASDNVLLGKYYIENRSNVHYNELSTKLIDALLATEDIRFHEHSGVDMKAIPRVFFGLLTFSSKGGGSCQRNLSGLPASPISRSE